MQVSNIHSMFDHNNAWLLPVEVKISYVGDLHGVGCVEGPRPLATLVKATRVGVEI